MTDDTTTLPPLRTLLWSAVGLGLGGALLFGQGCPDDGGDIDPTPPDVSDDDDASVDDDDAGPDDDDLVIPEGIPIGGTLSYQPTDGTVPPGDVRAGLFLADPAGFTFAAEWHSDLVVPAKTSLTAGQVTYANYLEETVEPELLVDIGGGVQGALFAPFTYVDGNGSGSFNGGDTLLSGSADWVVYIDAESEEDVVEALGSGGPGWNVLRDVLSGEIALEHRPEGVNSSQGLAMRVRLLSVTGGDVPVETDIAFPEGSLMAAWHGSLSGLMEIEAPANPVLFVTPAVNNLRDDLIDWSISGTPPADHVGDLDPDLLSGPVPVPGLTGALYTEVGWVDDGDLAYSAEAPCDLLIADGNKTLVWLAAPGENLDLAFLLGVVLEQRPGWLLIDTLPRRLGSGIDMEILEGVGDDDDSAGFPYDLPDDCFGDDDDSADDDDSGAEEGAF